MVRALPFAHTERGDMQRVNHLWILAPLLAAACGGGAPESQQCSSLQGGSPIAAVRSSGGAPDLAVDGNPATSWSCSGACWIDLDLGSVRQLDAVGIQWAGAPATRYQVSVSDDGVNYATSASGVGATCERQPLTAAGRFIRLAIDADAAQPGIAVAELRVDSQEITSSPGTPSVPPGPVTPPPPGSTADAFGVTMLYPSATGGESWTLPSDPRSDARFDPQNTITPNADGSWKMQSAKVRMEVFTSTGYDAGKITTNRDTLASRGYMQAPNDWKNIEITGFVKVNSASLTTDNFAWYARGGRHSDPIPCEGSAYKGGLHYDGRARFEKESWHVSYRNSPYAQATSSIMNRWVGFKTVMRNVTAAGKTAV